MMPPSDLDDVRHYVHFRRKVIFSVSEYIEKHGGGLFDISELDFDKKVVLHAYLIEIAKNTDKTQVDFFAIGATLLASFQPNVGRRRLTADKFQKLLLTPLFAGGEISEADRKSMSYQMEILKIFNSSINERREIWEQVEYAKYLNSSIQTPLERLRRRAWKVIRLFLRVVVVGVLLMLALPLLLLPAQRRKELLAVPSDWINKLSEPPAYEWREIWLHFK